MQYVKLPLRRARPINPTRRKCRIALTNSQIQLIFDRFPKEDIDHNLPLLLGYRCGMQIGEIFALTWEDIDFETMKINIRKQVQYNDKLKYWILCPPKYDSYRIIDMDNTIDETLLNKKTVENNYLKIYGALYTELYIDSKQFLCSYKMFEMKKIDIEGIKGLTAFHSIHRRLDGTYVQEQTMQYVSSIIHHKLDIKEFDIHTLRHTHTTNLLAAGADIKFVQARLGHKSVKTTLEIYDHLNEFTQSKSVSVLNSL